MPAIAMHPPAWPWTSAISVQCRNKGRAATACVHTPLAVPVPSGACSANGTRPPVGSSPHLLKPGGEAQPAAERAGEGRRQPTPQLCGSRTAVENKPPAGLPSSLGPVLHTPALCSALEDINGPRPTAQKGLEQIPMHPLRAETQWKELTQTETQKTHSKPMCHKFRQHVVVGILEPPGYTISHQVPSEEFTL